MATPNMADPARKVRYSGGARGFDDQLTLTRRITPNRLRPACVAGLLAATLCGALAASADAYVRGPFSWPNGRVTYYNGVKAQDAAVRRAVRAWNASGARIKLSRVSRARARVQIRYLRTNVCMGLAQTRARGRSARRATIYLPRPSAGCADEFVNTIIVAHEFGHVLGLGHEGRVCALMNPEGHRTGGRLCQESDGAQPWLWRCRVLEPDDVRGMIGIYGGRYRADSFAAPPLCPLYADPPPPTELQAIAGAASTIDVSFRRPADAQIPAFLLAERHADPSYEVALQPGACQPAASGTRRAWTVAPGGVQTLRLQASPGRYCVLARVLDQMGRPSAPATVEALVS